MSEPKTRKTRASVTAFLDAIQDPETRRDCRTLARMMREITGARAAMWGESMVGFGSYHYRYASGREGDWFLAGFSPRRQNLTIYIMAGFSGSARLLGRLGRHRTGKACLYVKRLADVDLDVLRELIERSVDAKRRSSA
ncbi:MAG: DUF1801 domain-containing protein [Candidatus Eiseniibacteriota bacterium]|jgi:hypothetical protein